VTSIFDRLRQRLDDTDVRIEPYVPRRARHGIPTRRTSAPTSSFQCLFEPSSSGNRSVVGQSGPTRGDTNDGYIEGRRASTQVEKRPERGHAEQENAGDRQQPFYSMQYSSIRQAGYSRPTPSFGAPTLVWHVAFWPREARESDNKGFSSAHSGALSKLNGYRENWVDEFNQFLKTLQLKGRPRADGRRTSPKQFRGFSSPQQWPGTDDLSNRFREDETIAFTLWWADPKEAVEEQTDYSALRVRVHAELKQDYATITFYLDIGQAWDEPHSNRSSEAHGKRRQLLLRAVDETRRVCEVKSMPAPTQAQIDVSGREDHGSPRREESLLDARNLLYVSIWKAFSAEMDCRLKDIVGKQSRVFVNARGLVMLANGLARSEMGDANIGAEDPPISSGEVTAVVRGFWPFIRRISPAASYGNVIACGVLNWRALYVSCLETDPVSLANHGSLLLDGQLPCASESEVRRIGDRPQRFLILSSPELDRRQIGRIVERVNTLATMRLYALKDWPAIRDADPQIRKLGQELDEITKQWSRDRRLITELNRLSVVRNARDEIRRLERQLATARTESERQEVAERFCALKANPSWTGHELLRLKRVMPTYTARRPANLIIRLLLRMRFFYNWRRYSQLLEGMENDLVADIRHAALYEASNGVESALIDISSKVDELGFAASGGLHFRLSRSAYYVREFQSLLRALQVRDIPSWTSYEQFARRELDPAFNYAAAVDKRLRAVRDRVLNVLGVIETSALVGQSAATRHNTAVLRQTTTLAIVVLIASSAHVLLSGQLLGWIGSMLRQLLTPVQ